MAMFAVVKSPFRAYGYSIQCCPASPGPQVQTAHSAGISGGAMPRNVLTNTTGKHDLRKLPHRPRKEINA